MINKVLVHIYQEFALFQEKLISATNWKILVTGTGMQDSLSQSQNIFKKIDHHLCCMEKVAIELKANYHIVLLSSVIAGVCVGS